jgi:hypothetical protein
MMPKRSSPVADAEQQGDFSMARENGQHIAHADEVPVSAFQRDQNLQTKLVHGRLAKDEAIQRVDREKQICRTGCAEGVGGNGGRARPPPEGRLARISQTTERPTAGETTGYSAYTGMA